MVKGAAASFALACLVGALAGRLPAAPIPLSEDAAGSWEVIMQGGSISYSTITLDRTGKQLDGLWLYDKRTTYRVSGTQAGSKIRLQIRGSAGAGEKAIGRIDASMDGTADMVGTITLAGAETPFQGSQHSRILALPKPIPPTPYGSIP
ncbi:MAG: hypothetical protein GIW99_10420 [Candidatus Eremiobacteraeota bacterium]|nr:hypothetical protein [Candidatus Eremiobacteraeota bacterium]MBC5828076.1 hypothetical protein [Candidatus Eremiobacteraeota bacterium]